MAVKKSDASFVSFGDLSMYVAGGGIPDGKYALEFMIQYEPETEKYKPPVPRLGAMITCHPLDGGDSKHKFLAFGGKAHESFAPDPDTGKKMVIKAGSNGAGAQTLAASSNWGYFLKSLYDAGLPQGVFTNDVSVLDGVHVIITNMPEPEERKGFRAKAKSSEVEGPADTFKGNSTIPVVSEIIEGGAPWEGGGGIPEAEAAKPVAKAGSKPVAAAAKTVAKPAVKAAVTAGPSDEDIHDHAVNSISSVLEKNPNGCARLVLRTQTFKKLAADADEDTANLVIDRYFSSDDSLNEILDELGYAVSGQKVVVKE